LHRADANVGFTWVLSSHGSALYTVQPHSPWPPARVAISDVTFDRRPGTSAGNKRSFFWKRFSFLGLQGS